MKFKIDSAYLCVQNMDRAISFYEKLFLKKCSKKDRLYSVMEIGGFRIGLFANNRVKEKVKYGDNCLLSIKVDGMKNFLKHLEGLNVKLVYPLTKIGKNWVIEFRDSEGNDLEGYSNVL
ncbi:MAG: VOC family protein [Candidatus Dojkabacteria bacterium]|jgi:predicted enzyme related to lactoylglutathione lyase|nr:VOC family protein [Candidatus Dojkabacteria bacterium]